MVLAVLLAACSHSAPPDPPGDGGSAATACEPGTREVAPDDCQPAGVPAELCGEGFEADGEQGCRAILPERRCPFGTMAVPGERRCREVAPCGTAPWGDIPMEPDTQYVDGAYSGADSDGSAIKPWTTVQQGVDAALPSALVAVASGTYHEDVVVSAKAIRLWGRCPSMVTIAGVSSTGFPLAFGSSIGSEVHGVAFEGPAWGVLVGIGSAVHIDRVWVHDTGWVGVQVERGATATVEGSLVENATAIGINAHQTDVNIDTSVIRGTRSEGALGGRGVNAQEDQGESATAAITRSLVEGNGDTGLFAGGSMLTVESSVVRDTADMFQSGGGILVRSSTDSHVRSGLTLRASVVENNLGGGVLVGSSDAAIEATTIRDTLPNDALLFGIGLAVTAIDATAGPADATVSASLVQRSHYCGVSVAGSVLSGDAVAIRDTLPRASDQLGGRGLAAQPNLGIESALTLVDSSVERNYEFGIVVTGTNDIEHTRVEGALARPDGLVGDAVAVWSGEQPGVLSLMRSRIAGAARAGITSFSATATLHEVVLDCNAIHLNGTDSGFGPFVFEDQGGNTCGCNAETTPCAVRSEKLEPPSPLDPPGA